LARRVLAGRGMAECVTFSFLARDTATLFADAPSSLRLVNPIAADLDQMRPTPVATLATAALRNTARGFADGALFEIGPAYAPAGQSLVAAGLRSGQTARHWQHPARGVTAMDAKADLWALLSSLGVPLDALTTVAEAPGYYHPGRSGLVRQGPKTILAHFGELHPTVQVKLGLEAPAVAFELFLDNLADPKRRKHASPDLPSFQPVRRDFAFVVHRDVGAESVLRAARGAERHLVARATLFDVYEGDKLEPDQKSLGIEVVLQPRERTLTDSEIDAVCGKIIQAVAKAGGTLR
jgi:phenylalanyl-tRNA synthetase beta chain